MKPRKKPAAKGKKLPSPPDERRVREAENRRKLLASLKQDVRELAIREFAKLGLTQ
jgi:hypothetical protein